MLFRAPLERSAAFMKISPDQNALPEAPQFVAPQASTAATQPPGAAPGSRAHDPERQNRKQPRTRTPTILTPAQLAVFERALARRNAPSAAGAASETTLTDRPNGPPRRKAPPVASRPLNIGSAPASAPKAASLSDLARMATTKRPLTGPGLASRRPKLAIFAVGSGLAALGIAVLTLELLRTPAVEPMHRAPLATMQPFSPSASTAAERAEGAAPQSTTPPAQQTGAPEDVVPPVMEAQTSDPGTEEPMHSGPPLGMIAMQGSTESDR